MKKCFVLFLITALVVTAQAASFAWRTSATGKVCGQGTTDLLASGSAYLFDSAVVSQQALLESVVEAGGYDGVASLTSLSSATVSSGAITETAFSWGNAGEQLIAYVAIIDGDYLFISDTLTGVADVSATKKLQFNLKTASQAAATTATTFSKGGWYAVPEPTSGLLMLMGMAGLALRRRRRA